MNLVSRHTVVGLGLLVASIGCAGSGCSVDTGPGPLEPAAGEGPATNEADDDVAPLLVGRGPVETPASTPHVVRSRAVGVRLAEIGILGDLRAVDASRAKRLQLNLFPGTTVRAELVQMTAPSERELVWRGHVAGKESATVVLSVVDGVAAAVVRDGNDVYELAYEGPDAYVVRQIDTAALPSEHCFDAPSGDAPGAPGGVAHDAPMADAIAADALPTDILVAYTPAARTQAGSAAAMAAQITTAVALANTAYNNSGIGISLRLVGTMEVAYTETNDPTADLTALASTTDGKMDEVHVRRDALGADFVSLVTSTLGSSCGVGYTLKTVSSAGAAKAFSVIKRDCMGNNQSLAHEIGHNMGAAHDVANASVTGAYSYSFGYQVPSKFRTIMAYPCTGSTCVRVDHFSNPKISYNGVPTGNADKADNARTLANTASTTSAYRPTKSTLNVPPAAAFSATPTTGKAPLVASFDASASKDPDGTLASYTWSFGDGGSSTGAKVNHSFGTAGSFMVTLTVKDDKGATASATKTITVTAAGTTDAGAPVDAGGVTCSSSRTACGGSCVRLDSNEDHCGACNRACADGASCEDGVCVCEDTVCGTDCVDLEESERHCGKCGNACPAGQKCWDGVCE